MTTTSNESLVNAFDAAVPNTASPATSIDTLAVPVAQAGQLAGWTGLSFLVYDMTTSAVTPVKDTISWLPVDVLVALDDVDRATRIDSELPVSAVATPLESASLIAVAVIPDADSQPPEDAVIAAADFGWSSEQLVEWWSRNRGRSADEIVRQLELGSQLLSSENQTGRMEWELESLAEQIDSTYEEISLLHFLAQNLQVSRETPELTTLCLERLRESINCGGAAVWLLEGSGNGHFMVDGDVPFDELQLAMLVASFDRHPWPQPLVRNHLDDQFAGLSAGVNNLIMVPVSSGGNRSGWIVAINASGGREFGTVEASLLQSIAVSLGTHLQNAEVIAEQEELLLSFVRSLVSSLDAKDPYTRGHSERVAMIARRLGIELGLDDQEIEDIYLSGLLHDIGKIGVNDGILTKPGRLTDEEFAEIQQHPTIGYHILGGIKKLKHILPGVRSHHEAMDGTGYPDGLAGYDIPMMARVLAVADSYDAMGSDRPYRNGMPLEKLEGILRDGRGSQWDPEIVDAYFACRDDIREICLDWTARQVS